MSVDPRRIKAAELRETMMRLASERGPSKAVDPMEVAVAVAGKDEKVWRRLMKPIRDEAQRLAKAGSIVVLRKGKPADPDKIRGLWRFRLRAEGEEPPVFESVPDEDDFDLDHHED